MANRAVLCPYCGMINWKYGEAMRKTYVAILNLDTNEFTVRQLADALNEHTDVVRHSLRRLIGAELIVRKRKQPMGDCAGAEVVYELTRKGLTHPLLIPSAQSPHPMPARHGRPRSRPQRRTDG